MGLVPRNASVHSFWRALLRWQGFGKASFSKRALPKCWSQGESCNFLWRGKINFRPIVLLFSAPNIEPGRLGMLAELQGRALPLSHSVPASWPVLPALLERLGNPNTRGAYPPCTSLPLLELGPAGPPDKEPLHFRRTGFNHVLPGLKLYATHLLAWAG